MFLDPVSNVAVKGLVVNENNTIQAPEVYAGVRQSPGLTNAARLDASGFLDVIVGAFDASSFGDGGPATAATLSYPASMVFDRFGNLFIADSNNNRIRAVRGPIP